MQAINAILGSELTVDSELTEAQMELLCGGEDYQEYREDYEEVVAERSSEEVQESHEEPVEEFGF